MDNKNMDYLLLLVDSFLSDIKDATFFMKSEYGDIHFLKAKNVGKLPKFLDNIKNSPIKRFGFHGRGATFYKKKYTFDIEFDFDTNSIGFSEWNLYNYLNKKNTKTVSLEETKEIILLLQKEKRIKGDRDCYIFVEINETK